MLACFTAVHATSCPTKCRSGTSRSRTPPPDSRRKQDALPPPPARAGGEQEDTLPPPPRPAAAAAPAAKHARSPAAAEEPPAARPAEQPATLVKTEVVGAEDMLVEDAPAAAGAGAEAAAIKMGAGGATANGVAKEGGAHVAKPVRGAAVLQSVRQWAVETVGCS